MTVNSNSVFYFQVELDSVHLLKHLPAVFHWMNLIQALVQASVRRVGLGQHSNASKIKLYKARKIQVLVKLKFLQRNFAFI